MSKVNITIDDLRILAERAKEMGTQDNFINLMLEWAEGADAKIRELEGVNALTNLNVRPRECTKCGRKSYDPNEGSFCNMLQPDSTRCTGVLVLR